MGTLYYGDNLTILSRLPSDYVDLVYLDPPFNSKVNYSVLFEADKAHAENEAFQDTWTWSDRKEADYNDLIANASRAQTEATIRALQGLYAILGPCGLLAYLLYMQPRLIELRRVLKPTGSIYLHCDPTASHYLKVLMDSIFGTAQYRNEIIRHRPKIGIAKRKFTTNTDTIFFYSKTDAYVFHPQRHDEPNQLYTRWEKKLRKGVLYYKEAKHIQDSPAQSKIRVLAKKLQRPLQDDDIVVDFNAEANKKAVDNMWYIPSLKGNAAEYLHYQTQKPLALLERIIKASSTAGDTVLDPFCGCGTAVDAAQALNRKWIGMDISFLSIDAIQTRLVSRYGGEKREFPITIEGVPEDMRGAEALLKSTLEEVIDKKAESLDQAIALAEQYREAGEQGIKNTGRFEFQRWCCSLIKAVPNDREIHDRGVDGKLKWEVDMSAGIGKEDFVFGAVVVKPSKYVSLNDVQELKGVIANGGYVMGILISLYKTDTEEIRHCCGDFTEPTWQHITGHSFPKLQVWSVEEYFESGKRPYFPTPMKPYKKAEKARMKVNQVEY